MERDGSDPLRRTIATVLIATLIVLAGCSGGGGTPASPGEETRVSETATATTSSDSNTNTEDETATNTSEPTFAEKYTNEEGYLGGETNKFGEYPYTIDHRDRMKKLDTYQLSLDRESSKYGSITATFKYGPTASYRVTNDSSSPSVMHEYMDREAGKTVTFADWKGGEKTSRSVENEQHSTPRQMWMGELPDDYGNYKFDHYMTEDGTDYAVFTATGGEDLRNEYPDTAEVSGKFVISENGLNKEVTLHATDSEGNTLYSYEMEVTGINETTVETPDWASSE